MADSQKTVFISYRRKASKYGARLLFDKLTEHGYDVFFDYESLPAGRWDEIIYSQIGARAHFLVLLARGTLSDCKKENDVLRKEIEHALRLKRNVVPVFMDGFDFKSKRYTNQLIGDLKKLITYQGVELNNLSDNFLRATLDTIHTYIDGAEIVQIIPAQPRDQAEAQKAVDATIKEPPPTTQQLNAEDYLNRAYEKYDHGDLAGTLVECNEAIRLDHHLAAAYDIRGEVSFCSGYYEDALEDFQEALFYGGPNINTTAKGALAFRAIDFIEDAKSGWRALIDFDPAYHDADWVGKELGWRPELTEAARNLIAELDA